jgi:hemolysin III
MSATFSDVPVASGLHAAIEGFEPATALRSRGEELEAAITHGAGAVLAALGGAYLVSEATHSSDLWCSVGCLFYSLALVGVLGSSSLSHLYLPEHLNRRFRAYDQGFIYLLAAGSLSPFALTFLRTPAWMGFYGLSVLLAATGFVSKVFFTHRVDKISLWFYLLLGWGQAIAMIPLASVLPAGAVGWILAGAACYSVGVIFLVLDIRRLRFHSIWHLFVLAACGCHYFAILRFVVHRAS